MYSSCCGGCLGCCLKAPLISCVLSGQEAGFQPLGGQVASLIPIPAPANEYVLPPRPRISMVQVFVISSSRIEQRGYETLFK